MYMPRGVVKRDAVMIGQVKRDWVEVIRSNLVLGMPPHNMHERCSSRRTRGLGRLSYYQAPAPMTVRNRLKRRHTNTDLQLARVRSIELPHVQHHDEETLAITQQSYREQQSVR